MDKTVQFRDQININLPEEYLKKIHCKTELNVLNRFYIYIFKNNILSILIYITIKSENIEMYKTLYKIFSKLVEELRTYNSCLVYYVK